MKTHLLMAWGLNLKCFFLQAALLLLLCPELCVCDPSPFDDKCAGATPGTACNVNSSSSYLFKHFGPSLDLL